MPALIIAPLASIFINVGLSLGLGALVWTIAPVVAAGVVYGTLAIGLSLASGLLASRPDPLSSTAPAVPRPVDGKHNLRQNVPSLPVVLGRVKKGGDYVLLEERAGVAYHLTVFAAHRIERFVTHYLHSALVVLDSEPKVVVPAHFNRKVKITTRLGESLETPYQTLIDVFPEIWTLNHRGDALASVLVEVESVEQENHLATYPHQMPVHTAIIEGAQLYDPRSGLTVFSRNLALIRLFHLTHPSGAKLTLDDMYLPDWIVAANVCDEMVLNRDGVGEPRYHGGLWYRYENDPVQVGRLIDQAGELVVYERDDGLIGVHAGAFAAPDVRLTEADIVSLGYDANTRQATNVLGVRGRYTAPELQYNTVDAAIFGDPYIADDDTERTLTIDNQVVQSHNHCQRLQKIAYLRARAPRVRIVAHYDIAAPGGAKNVPYRRFVTVHYPSRGMDEAVVEVIGRPKLSLNALTVEFDGLVLSAELYAFDAATEEGVPNNTIAIVEVADVPEPTGFAVEMVSEVLVSGQNAALARATWTFVTTLFTYEFEYQIADESEPARSVLSRPGETSVQTPYLADATEYRFRLRTWSHGVPSPWTDYVTDTTIADPVAPDDPTDFDSALTGTDATLSWINPNNANFVRAVLYHGTAADPDAASVVIELFGLPGATRQHIHNGLAAGDHYWWVEAFNGSGVGSGKVGPVTETVV